MTDYREYDYDHEPEFPDYDEEGHGYDCPCEECTYEYLADECGLLPEHLGGGCTLAGTEHCDFDCPFGDEDDE